MSSPNTVINAAVYDAAGNIWAVNNSGVITINYKADTTTANVVTLYYNPATGQLWQQNNTGRWWYKTTAPTGNAWLPQGGTLISPLPTVPSAPTGVIAT